MDDKGFGKINFQDSSSRIMQRAARVQSGNNVGNDLNNMRRRRRNNKKKVSFINLKSRRVQVILGIIILVVAYSLIRGYFLYRDGMALKAQAKTAYAAVKDKNVVQAKDELVKTQTQLAKTQRDLHWFVPFGWIPLVGGYYHDADHVMNAASSGINAAIIASDSLIPYADVLGLKGGGSFSGGSAQDRIRLAVQTMDKVVPKIDDIGTQLAAAQKEIDQVNSNRYPNIGPMKKVRAQIDSIKTLTNEGVDAVQQGKPLIKLLPELLGESEPKKYLILFQNDKELRPTGGFLTYYSIFNVDEGVVTVDSSSNIYDLDNSIASHPAPPRIIAKYFPTVNRWYIRDTNLSPDFVTSMKDFNAQYKKSSVYKDVDGIVALDTNFLVHALDILGDVEAGGITFNSKNDPRCDCPEAVYELESNISTPVNYVRENRKALLGDLLYALMQKALSSSPKEYWGRLVQSAMTDAQHKDVLFYLYNPDAQKGIEALNWGGRVNSTFAGDYLNINDANFGGAKSNMYVTDSVKMEYTTDSNGTITKKVTISYKNPQRYSNCNLESGGLCLNATLRNFQRVYVPKGSTLVSSTGSQVRVTTNQDLGRTDFEAFMTVNPLGTAEISYTYTLPFKLGSDKTIPLLIQKQPGKSLENYQIFVNGKEAATFDLTTDKQLDLKV